MEAETILRILRLENDMMAAKEHQSQQEGQIEILAEEIQKLHKKVDQLVTTERYTTFEKKIEKNFLDIKTQLKMIAEALAL